MKRENTAEGNGGDCEITYLRLQVVLRQQSGLWGVTGTKRDLAACATKTVTVTGAAAGSPSSSSSSASLVPSSPANSYTPPPPDPKPDAKYSHSCDYLLGNFQDYSPQGFRFIAEARLNNTGNVGVVVKVTASWTTS